MFYNWSGIGVNIEKYAEILDDYNLWNYEKRTKPSFVAIYIPCILYCRLSGIVYTIAE